jgi:hypothetical protein
VRGSTPELSVHAGWFYIGRVVVHRVLRDRPSTGARTRSIRVCMYTLSTRVTILHRPHDTSGRLAFEGHRFLLNLYSVASPSLLHRLSEKDLSPSWT